MQDRPTRDELLGALEYWLDNEVVAKQQGALRYQGRVAANIVRTVRRELEHEEEALDREWRGLDALLGEDDRPENRAELRNAIAARTEDLCARIRAGDADGGPFRAATLGHVRATVRDKLLVTNPGWLGEDGQP